MLLIWAVRYANGRPPMTTRKGSFWWRDIQKLLPAFKGMAMANVGNGSSCFFLLDTWNGLSLSTSLPELFSFAKNRHITIQQVYQTAHFHDLFHLPYLKRPFDSLLSSLFLCNPWSYKIVQIHGPISRIQIFFL